MSKKYSLENEVAIVTGGARGIGLATARAMAELGAYTVLWDIDQAALEAAQAKFPDPSRVLLRQLDITDLAEVNAATAEAEDSLGRIDILVNSAGITGPIETTWDYAQEDWNRVIAINLGGVYHACKAVAPRMVARGYGRIVNVASIGGKEGNARAPAYAASKGGVIAMTKSLGKELIGTGVVANSVCPAAVETELLSQMKPEFVSALISKIPMGRLGKSEEVANLILYLTSHGCSFSTGAVYDCSGGRATY